MYPLFDVEKYKQSPIQYGLVTVKYPNLQGLELSDQDFEPSLAIHYALASASCFPVFPVYSIDQQAYIDGGYFDNLPISLALKMGAEHIIAIDLNQVPTHSHFTHRPNIQMILPSHDLGNFLDFNRDVLDQRIELGYLDTMKAFHQFRGYQYAFKKNKPINASLLYQIILQHEDQLNRTHTKHLKNNCPITSFLMRNCNQQIVSQEDYAILALECVLSYYDYSFIKCYDFHICAQEVYQLFMNHYGENRELYEKSHSRLSQIAETLRQFTSKQRIYYLFEELVTTKNLNIGITERFFEQEMVIALFMYCYSINQFK